MKILVVTPFMWSGAGKAIVRIAQDLQSLGHRLCVVSSGRSKGLADWPCYVDQLRGLRIRYETIDFFDRTPEVFWSSVETLRDRIETFKPDVIHAHSGMAAFGAIAASNIPVLATVHSWNPSRPAWMNTMDLWALNKCGQVVCVSSSYRDFLLAQGLRAETSRVIYLGIHVDEIREMASQAVENPLRGKKYFCYLGRLESRKRQKLLVELLKTLSDDWSLMLIGGEGEPGYARGITDHAEQIGVLKRLVCMGHVENPYPLMREARCFVSTSNDEGLGLAALEAMALGLPVISTPACGIVDFVHDGQTGLISSADSVELAAKVIQLERDSYQSKKLTDNAMSMLHDTFSWPQAIDRYASLLEDVVQYSLC
jgi:glycosyltransferase involved in cell wall biosynthesis